MPQAHAIGRRSATAVQKLFVDAGCAADVIVSDYGEDLYIQSQLNGEADDFQILVQVKTINAKRKSITVDIRHLHRWVNMINPVFLCGYNQTTGDVHLISTQQFFTRWQLLDHPHRTKSFKLSDESILQPEGVERFLWNARLSYYHRLIALCLSDLEEKTEFLDGESDPTYEDDPADIFLILLKVLFELQLLDDDGANPEFVDSLRRFANEFRKDDAYDIVAYAFAMATLEFVDHKFGIGLPYNLMKWLPEALGYHVKTAQPDLWSELEAGFERNWYPLVGEAGYPCRSTNSR